jgi:lysophospholipase L1-like esterase
MVIRLALLALLAAIAPAPVIAVPVIGAEPATMLAETPTWVGTWEAAQVGPRTTGLSDVGFTDQTIRDIVHTSAGGGEIRIRISNVFGTRPLRIDDVRVALGGPGAQTVTGTSHRLTFGGNYQVTIPAGAREFSDAVRMRVGADEDLDVSMFVKGASGPTSWHPAAISASYYSVPGDHTMDADGTKFTHQIHASYFVDGVDVINPAVGGAVVTFGASTTDGLGSTFGANESYPADLARSLLGLPPGLALSVLNAGILANQLLASGPASGPSGLARFSRDALAQSDVRVIIVWLGTNDIDFHRTTTAGQMIGAYEQLIAAAHARGIAVVGATLQPEEGATSFTEHGNRVREEINRWIRHSREFDAVADFDMVLRDPQNPDQLLPAYDSGDHLHPNDAGYQAIADSIDPWQLAGLALAGDIDHSDGRLLREGGSVRVVAKREPVRAKWALSLSEHRSRSEALPRHSQL